MKRRFSRKEKTALYLAADGKSEISGEPLPEAWHADHVIAWSKGGETDVVNGQALTASENLKKGKSGMKLREWQKEFIQAYVKSSSADFSLMALPGGGKTVAALSVAKMFLAEDQSSKIIVVVPTTNLVEQWAQEAASRENGFSIQLQTKEFYGSFKSDFNGAVTTYQSVASNALVFRRLVAKHRCLVIFDEIHHAGDQSSWGISIEHAFEHAHRRLCMSGTPYKHNGQRIPFLRIEQSSDGELQYAMDFKYDWPRALREKVVREIIFPRWKGEVELMFAEGQIVKFHTDDELSEDDENRRLSGLLRSDAFIRTMLRHANDELTAVRRSKPDAGGLAICIDTDHATRIRDILTEITGEIPDVVLSDDTQGNSSVREFRNSQRKWIVAVRMVSEGVDIKRLQVLAYLTNYTTNLFFRQAVGRIMRYQRTDFDTEAYCFIPEDRRLIEHAATIQEFQAAVAKQEDEEFKSRPESDHASEAPRIGYVILGSSDAEFAGMTTAGNSYEAEYSNEIKSLAAEFGVPQAVMARITVRLRQKQETYHQEQPSSSREDTPLEEAMGDRRTTISRLVARLARRRRPDNIGEEIKQIHNAYLRFVGIPQAQLSMAQLEAKIQWLQKQLAQA